MAGDCRYPALIERESEHFGELIIQAGARCQMRRRYNHKYPTQKTRANAMSAEVSRQKSSDGKMNSADSGFQRAQHGPGLHVYR